MSYAAAFGVLSALDTSPESDLWRLLVLLLTQLVYLFVFLGAPSHNGRAPGVTPSQAQTNIGAMVKILIIMRIRLAVMTVISLDNKSKQNSK